MDLNPRFRLYLIKAYCCDLKLWKTFDNRTKNILLKDALTQHNKKIIQEYGSLYAQRKEWCKKHGYKTVWEYQKTFLIIPEKHKCCVDNCKNRINITKDFCHTHKDQKYMYFHPRYRKEK